MEANPLDRAPVAEAPLTKRCRTCKEDKPTSEFYVHPGTGEVRPYCRPCERIEDRSRYKSLSAEKHDARTNSHKAWYLANKAKCRERVKKYRSRPEVKERERAWGRERYKKNSERLKAYAREWTKNNPDKHLNRTLKGRFNITLDQYRQMLTAQDNLCAICRKPEQLVRDGKPQRLGVDHDHACCPGERTCGKCVRALLCSMCNFGIGAFKDDLDRVMLAAEYLRKWKR